MSQPAHEEEGFGLSIGDVMSALLLIIILLMMNIVYKLSEEVDKSSQFDKLQEQLYLALEDEFEEDLERLYMEIDSSGVVNFVNPSVLFESNRAQIRPGFAGVLREFFPRYLDVLTGDQFRSDLREIRIEGHTSSDGPTQNPYLYNLQLSQSRSFNVLQFVLSDSLLFQGMNPEQTGEMSWFKDRTVAMGFSSSQLVYLPQRDSTQAPREDKLRSRRVSFRPLIDFEKFRVKRPEP